MSKARARPPVSFETRCAASPLRSATMTLAPASAKRRHRAAPIAPPPPVTSTFFPLRPFIGFLSLLSLVDDALRLADGPLDGADRHDLHVGGHPDVRLDVVRQLCSRSLILCTRLNLRQHRHVVHGPILAKLDHVVWRKFGLP